MARRQLILATLAALLLTGCGLANTAGPASSSAPAGAPSPAAAQAGDRKAAVPTAQVGAAPATTTGSAAERAAAPAAAPALGVPGAPRVALPAPAPTPAPKVAQNATRPAEAGDGPSGTASLPAVSLPNRMIVYTTSLTLLVRSVDESVSAVGDLAAGQGGYLAGVENSSEQGLPVSTVRIKVPPERYQVTMNELRRLAIEVRDEKASTQDVTEEYSDVQTQLASLEATHRQLLDLLARASTMDEILKIQQQAAQVKLQIDRLRGRATVLERLSDLATITARLQSAEAVLARDYTTVRGQLRQAQSQRAAQLLALKRARTPEDEAKIRDTIGELDLQIARASARLKDLEQKASQGGVTLPSPAPDEQALTAPVEQELPEQYIAARVQLRQVEARQAELTRQLKLSLPAEELAALRQELSAKILEAASLNARLKTIQERAAQAGVALPNLTPEQEAALAGTTVESRQPDPWRAVTAAWDASLTFLRGALAVVLGAIVFLWWALPLALAGGLLLRNGLRGDGWIARRRRAATRPEPTPPTA